MPDPTTVLVVEDEELIADDLRRTLTRLGYAVPDAVATGRAAVERAEALRPRLVLMDIKLKGSMDGIEAATEIRRRFDIPVVYLTSHSDDTTLGRAKESQPYGYILKPFEDGDLRTSIEVAIHKHEFESRLQRREHWFATTLESIGDAVIATDPQGAITFMNVVAERLTDWNRTDALGQKVQDVFRIVDARNVPVASPIHEGPTKGFTVRLPALTSRLLDRGGRSILIDDTAAPIVDEAGTVYGGVVVFRDITERRKLEQRLAHAEQMASLGSMAAGIAHEINNPLTYVIGYVSLSIEGLERAIKALEEAGEGGPSPAESKVVLQLRDIVGTLNTADKGAERVRRIVYDLRRFGRVDEGPSAVLDLPNLLDEAVKMMTHAVRYQARLRREYRTTPFVAGNEGQLVRVFTNVLVNAAQAVSGAAGAQQEIAIATRTDRAGRAVVEIRDTGPGIAPEVLPRVFDPFFTTRPVGAGMGLGLSISHSVVVAMGGEMTAENGPGGGALVRIVLPPASSESAHAVGATSMGKAGSTRPARILVVDDEPAVADCVARMLRLEHEVTVETDPRRALARIAAGPPYDVVFCDLQMPEMSGIDLHAAVASANPEQAARIVFMTGGGVTPATRDFLDGVGNVALFKPFTLDAIRTIVADRVK